jgi:hypothetical protein
MGSTTALYADSRHHTDQTRLVHLSPSMALITVANIPVIGGSSIHPNRQPLHEKMLPPPITTAACTPNASLGDFLDHPHNGQSVDLAKASSPHQRLHPTVLTRFAWQAGICELSGNKRD